MRSPFKIASQSAEGCILVCSFVYGVPQWLTYIAIAHGQQGDSILVVLGFAMLAWLVGAVFGALLWYLWLKPLRSGFISPAALRKMNHGPHRH